jgi:hypothetical protein
MMQHKLHDICDFYLFASTEIRPWRESRLIGFSDIASLGREMVTAKN